MSKLEHEGDKIIVVFLSESSHALSTASFIDTACFTGHTLLKTLSIFLADSPITTAPINFSFETCNSSLKSDPLPLPPAIKTIGFP